MRPAGVVFIRRFVAGVVVCGMALAMKHYYQTADSSDLMWLLTPTAALVEWLSGVPFSYVEDGGWLNIDHRVVIAPACAGVNYLVIAFCMSAIQGIGIFRRTTDLAAWIAFSAMTALLLTVLVNALRIWLSLVAFTIDLSAVTLSAAGLHRLVGVSVYYLFLCFHYLVVSFMLKSVVGQRAVPAAITMVGVPLCWYLLVTLGVPLLRDGNLLTSEAFINHGSMVLLTSLGGALWLGALVHVTGRLLSGSGMVGSPESGFTYASKRSVSWEANRASWLSRMNRR